MSYHWATVVDQLGPLACCDGLREKHTTVAAGRLILVNPRITDSHPMVCRFCGQRRNLTGVSIVYGWPRVRFISVDILDIDEGVDPEIQAPLTPRIAEIYNRVLRTLNPKIQVHRNTVLS